MTLSQLQKQIDDWITTYGVRYFDEMTNLALLVEEVGELSRLLARRYGEQSFKAGREPKDIQEDIANEMCDVLFVLTCLANQTGVDMESAMKRNLEKKTQRDHKRHRDNDKLHDSTR